MRLPTLLARCTRMPSGQLEVLERVVTSELQRLDVRLQQRLLALVLFREQLLDFGGVDVEQRREGADIDDVLEQLALPRVAVGRIADLGERHADEVDVLAELRFRQRLGVVVEQIAAGFDFLQIRVPGLRVHRHHQVDAAAPGLIAGLVDAHLVPGRQALDVGREDVARGDRHAHPQDGAREQLVGRSRSRAVDVGELDDEIVYGLDAFHSWLSPHAAFRCGLLRQPGPACVMSSRNFCMSQAPVGQRSAHSPQCRHTSSSFAITRPVIFSTSET